MSVISPERFIRTLREKFIIRLSRKNSWGKNEIELEFERAVSETLSSIMEGFAL
jgi:hypothetical protein